MFQSFPTNFFIKENTLCNFELEILWPKQGHEIVSFEIKERK